MIEQRGLVAANPYFGINQACIIGAGSFMVVAVIGPSLKANSKMMFLPDSFADWTTPSISIHWPSSAPASNCVRFTLGAIVDK